MLNELLNKIDYYLIEQSSLEELETWLLSNLQRILDSGNKDAVEVANDVDADLVEFHEKLIDEATLRERLDSYITHKETVSITSSEIETYTVNHMNAAQVNDVRLKLAIT